MEAAGFFCVLEDRKHTGQILMVYERGQPNESRAVYESEVEDDDHGESLKTQARNLDLLDSVGNLQLLWDLKKGNDSINVVFYKINLARWNWEHKMNLRDLLV